ncbi:MAG: LysR family transcriptional regulator [Ramlibacter sp.]
MTSIRSMKTFLAVARLGSFSAAGQQIGLTPAAVGLQMKALESDLDCQLFQRSARAVLLNPAGRRLAPEFEALVQRYESVTTGLDQEGLSGNVVVGALVSSLMGAFSDALWAIKRDHPRLEVQLFAGLSADLALRVERGDMDAAVVTQAPHQLAGSLRWTELYAEPMVLIVPRHPHFEVGEDLHQILATAPFIRFERDTWTGKLVQEVLDACGAGVNEGMQLNSNEAIIELVRHGFGVSIVPQLANVRWKSDRLLRIIPLQGIDIRRRVGLLERSTHSRQAFTGVIKDYFRQNGAGAKRKPMG